ncbi:hypothetical protein [Xanthomonas sacchari]|uniref:hypothetical protein n=1 Tax=Xanthomonas sacchari TaxID=56458 RepID=UPI0020C2CB90|nr:hypothetical protein [Xanthomonas sacchari]
MNGGSLQAKRTAATMSSGTRASRRLSGGRAGDGHRRLALESACLTRQELERFIGEHPAEGNMSRIRDLRGGHVLQAQASLPATHAMERTCCPLPATSATSTRSAASTT